jgi:hypothetical protein
MKTLICLIPLCAALRAQTVATPVAPALLPGKGLAQHDFFYAGEQKQHWMFLVRQGKVAWSYIDAASKGEISDAVLLSNGNVLFAHQFGVTMISAEKKVLWSYDAPAGTEIHTAQPIGKQRVVFIQNGDPAILRVVNIVTGATEREFMLPVGNPKSVHGQFRHARLTPAGTLLVAHMDNKKVAEYDAGGKEVWSVALPFGPWAADRLPNGNTLISSSKLVREVDAKGETVWELKPEDVPEYKITGFQIAKRLENGNTLVNNWLNTWQAMTSVPVQALEVTPQKKVVWALHAVSDPDLGPSTTIQLLDRPSTPENARFGEFR